MSATLTQFENGEQFVTYVDGELRVWTVDRGVPRSIHSPEPERLARLEHGKCELCDHWAVDHTHLGCTRDCRCDRTMEEARTGPSVGGRHVVAS